MLQDPVAAYDRIAPVFPRLANERSQYLDSIDRLVISAIPQGSASLLDVGAGDGSRAHRIAAGCGIRDIVLAEPSVGMRHGASAGKATVWTLRAEDLHSAQGRFDVIQCLWNVLGHVAPANKRIEVLRQFGRLLAPGGRIFVDVSHRYNARHYGVLRTAFRWLRDRLRPDEKNGDVIVAWKLENGECTTTGHVFTDREVRSLCRSAQLNIDHTFVVDYATGRERRWKFEGHLLYVLSRP